MRGSGSWVLAAWLSASLAWPLVAAELVARGKGVVVTQEELDALVVEQKLMLEGRGQRVSAGQEGRIEALTLDRLIMRRLLVARANEEDKAKAKEIVEKGIAAQRLRFGSEEAYRRQVLASGLKLEDFEKRLLEEAIADRVVLRELGPKVQISEEQERDFYDLGLDMHARELRDGIVRMERNEANAAVYKEATNRLDLIRRTNLDRLEKPAESKARVLMLLLQDPQTGRSVSEAARKEKLVRMEDFRRRALGGEDFGVLAAEHSEEPGARSSRGEYVAWETQVAPELRAPLFAGPTNQVSEVIVSDKGYYLVQVLERHPGGKVSFEDSRSEIRNLLQQQAIEKLLPDWIKQLRKENGVEVLLKSKE